MPSRTLGGAKLLEAVRKRAAEGDVRFRLVVPQNNPSVVQVIYDEAVHDSAQARVDLALSLVAGEGIEATGEVGDIGPVPRDDGRDRLRAGPDEISDLEAYPAASSGWLRRDLVERIRNASGLPVEHVVVDLEQDGLPFKVSLVLASRTRRGGEELLERFGARRPPQASSGCSSWIVPQPDKSGSERQLGARSPRDDARPPAQRRACSAPA